MRVPELMTGFSTEELLWDGFDRISRSGLAQALNSLWGDVSRVGLGELFEEPNTLLEAVLSTVGEADCESLRAVLERHEQLPERLQALGHYLDRHQEYLEKHARVWTELYRLEAEGKSSQSWQRVLNRYQELLNEFFPSTASQGAMLLGLVSGLILQRATCPHSTPSFTETFEGLAGLLC